MSLALVEATNPQDVSLFRKKQREINKTKKLEQVEDLTEIDP